jgi:hypothetical protein
MKLGMVAHTCNHSYVGGIGKRSSVQGQSRQRHKTIIKIAKTKRAGGMVQVVESLHHKSKALSLNSSTSKHNLNYYQALTMF